MADSLKTGAGALLAFQRAIATTSHNIANSSTEGYTRQRVDLQANVPIQRMYGHVGQGVQINNIERLQNQFAEKQLLQTGSDLARLTTLHDYASQIDNLLATSSLTLTPAINGFFSSLADANNNPTDSASRMGVVSGAEQLAGNFRSLYAGLDAIRGQMSGDLSASVNEINELTQQIAKLDQSIVAASGNPAAGAANDLLDQRNILLGQLSEQLDINTIESDNGGIDIYIANGQSLLTGGISRQLQLMKGNDTATSIPIAITDGSNTQLIGEQLSGGKIGGLIDFNRNVLSPANNELGRLAITLASAMNTQHAMGVDSNGELGGTLFKLPQIAVEGNADNAGSASVTADFSNSSILTTSSYEVGFNGVDYTLTRLSDNNVIAGGSSLSMDGITVEVSGSMNTDDTFRVAPTRYAARDFSATLISAEQLALGSPLRAEAALANTGTAQASLAAVLDPDSPAFQIPVNIVFNQPPSTFDLIDQNTGTAVSVNVAYLPDQAISLNGWTAQINGAPNSGDTFTIELNQGGIASNHNGLALAALQNESLIGGIDSLSDVYGLLVANVGTRTRQAELNTNAMQSLHNSALDRRENISGVNLDEEAINLTRYQQAYQAAAQVINTADQMFETLIGAIR